MENSFNIVTLDKSSADQAFQLMSTVRDQLHNKEIYVVPSCEYIYDKLDKGIGELLGCVNEEGMLYAVMLYLLPNDDENYVNLLSGKYPKETIVHTENVAVLPAYRGKKLQRYLLEAGEIILRQKFPERTHYLCTVHPQNTASVKNLKAAGYKRVARFDKIEDPFCYGLRRDVMEKSF